MVKLRTNDRVVIIRENVKLDSLISDIEGDIRLLYKTVNLNKADILSFIYAKYNKRLLELLSLTSIESLDTKDIIKNMINDIYK